MDSDLRSHSIVTLAGLAALAGILYLAFSVPADMPSGYLAASGVTSCCGDCSCSSQEICSSCPRCVYTDDCRPLDSARTPGGFELITAARVAANGSFIVNAVIYPQADGKMLVELDLPAGFSADRDSALVDLYAGEAQVVGFKVRVKENVAEQEHTVRAELVDASFKAVSSAEADVNVYWGG